MTAACSGGTSSATLGLTGVVTFTATAVGAFLEKVAPRDVALFLAPFIAGGAVEATTFCGSDPPTAPTITAADFFNLTPYANPVDTLASQQKFQQWFYAQYWCQICKCDNGLTPNCSGTSLPSNPVVTNPGLPSGSATDTGCFDQSNAFGYTAFISGSDIDLSQYFLPTSIGSVSVTTSGTPFTSGPAYLLPTGSTKIEFISTKTCAAGAADSPIWIGEFNAAGTLVADGAIMRNTANGGQQTITRTLQATTVSCLIHAIAGASAADVNLETETIITCPSGGGGTIAQPCCPPDDSTSAILNAIFADVQLIIASLPAPITSFSTSTVHAGLTGSGTISIAGACISIKVELTTIPSHIGVELGAPNFYFDCGFLAFTTIEGTYSSQRITFATQIFSVPTLGYTVSYTLLGGVVATITELTRGP